MKPVAQILRRWPLRCAAVLFALCCGLAPGLHATTVDTLTGGPWQGNLSYYGYQDGDTANAAQFHTPYGLATDASGNSIFVADRDNNAIRRLNIAANWTYTFLPNVYVSTNLISQPVGVVVYKTNVFVLNRGNGTNGTVLRFDSTFGELIATNAAALTNAAGIAADTTGNLYVTARGNTLLRIAPPYTNSTVVTTNFPAGASLQGLVVKFSGLVAICDSARNGIYHVDPATGVVTTNSGFHGVGDFPDTNINSVASNNVRYSQPYGLAVAGDDTLIVTDTSNHRVKLVLPSGIVTNLYGCRSNLWYTNASNPDVFPGWWDGSVLDPDQLGGVEARSPVGIVFSPDGSLYVTEQYYHLIRKITGHGLIYGGDPTGTNSLGPPLFKGPAGIALDSSGVRLYVADTTNNAVQMLNFSNNLTTTFLSLAQGMSRPVDVAVDATNNIYVLNQGTNGIGSILEFDPYGNLLAIKAAGLTLPTALTLDGYGNVFVAEQAGPIKVFGTGLSNAIVTITNAGGVDLEGIGLYDDGTIAVSDAANHVIWQVHPITKAISILTGALGTNGTTLGASNFAKLYQPHRLARAAGDKLVAADYGNNRVVVVERSGAITNVLNSTNSSVWFGRPSDPVVAGSTNWVPMISPVGVAVGAGVVYSSEVYSNDIRGMFGNSLAQPPPGPFNILPYFSAPSGLALDTPGTHLYVADTTNDAVQILSFADNSTIAFVTTNNQVSRPVDVLVDPANNVFVLNQGTGGSGYILEFDPFRNTLATNATGLIQPTAFTLDGYGNIFVVEQGGNVKVFGSGYSNSIIATITTNTGVNLQGIALFDDGAIAVSDASNHVIWQINPITKEYRILTGTVGSPGSTLGSAAFAKLNQPRKLARSGGDRLVAADYANNRLVVVERSGAITNVLDSANSRVWFGRPGDYAPAGNPRWVSMISPVAVTVGPAGTVYASEVFYNDVRGLLGTIATTPPTPPFDVLPFYNTPQGIALDSSSSWLFIADLTNNAVYQLDLTTDTVSPFLTADPLFNSPVDVALDAGDNVYVLNQGNGKILTFDWYGNLLDDTKSGLTNPTAFTMDGSGNIFVTEKTNSIHVFSAAGASYTLATITNASTRLEGIAIFDDGNLAVSDAGAHVVWLVNPITKEISKLTGVLNTNGTTLGASNFAKLNQPHRLTRAAGNKLVCADYGNNRLVVIQRSGAITNVLNSTNANVWFGRPGDPVATNSTRWVTMKQPVGVAVGTGGEVFASEVLYHDIRGLFTSVVTPPAAPPFNILPFFAGPVGITLNTSGSRLFIADPTNNIVYQLNSSDNTISVFATTNMNQPVAVVADGADNLYVLNQGTGVNGSILKFNIFGNLLTTNATGLSLPTAIALDGSTNLLVCELAGAVKRIPAIGGPAVLLTVVTNGAGVQLRGIAVKSDGTIAISDAANHAIYQLNAVTSAQSLLTGNNGPGSAVGTAPFAQLNQPHHLAKAGGGLLVVSDYGSDRVVVVDGSGTVTNLPSANSIVWFGQSGDPVSPGNSRYVSMRLPSGIAIAGNGDVFTSEVFNENLRKISPTGLPGPGVISGTNALVNSPTIDPNSGYFPMGHVITVNSAVPDVFYTTDGTIPTTNSARVPIGGNVGTILWNNPTNDLTALRLIAISGTNSSLVVSGVPASTNNIGVPLGRYSTIQAGVGSTIVVPVVVNLRTNVQIKSFQFNVEITPKNSTNIADMIPATFDALSISSNDFVGVVTAAQGGAIATYGASLYTSNTTRGLTVTAIGSGANVLFSHYAAVAMLKVPIPNTATQGQQYNIQVFWPSATSDANQTPVPLLSLPATTILVTNVPYTVGDAAPGGWYNAGDFGDGDLANNDVNATFYAAAGLLVPHTFSDAFDAMDSYPQDAPGFVGGDGQIRFLDWQTTLDRALRLDTNNWTRAWSSAGDHTNFGPIGLSAAKSLSAKNSLVVGPGHVWYRQARIGFTSGGNGPAGSTMDVPVYVRVIHNASLAGLLFHATVTPDSGAPALTQAVQFVPAAGIAGPSFSKGFLVNELACVWSLGSLNFPSQSSNLLGYIRFVIPPAALAGQNYTVTFAQADGAPNKNEQYDFESAQTLVRVGNTPVSLPDGISDEWKIYFFGSVNNPNAGPNADPDGDHSSNQEEFLNGTNPTNAASRLKLEPKAMLSSGQQKQLPLQWLSAPGKVYSVDRATRLAVPDWSSVGTVDGDGYQKEYLETNLNNSAVFYRIRVISP